MRSFYIYMSTEVKQSKVHRNIKLFKKKKTEMKKKIPSGWVIPPNNIPKWPNIPSRFSGENHDAITYHNHPNKRDNSKGRPKSDRKTTTSKFLSKYIYLLKITSILHVAP